MLRVNRTDSGSTRLEMDIVDGCCLARQLRWVEIVDLVRTRVGEQVEDIEPEPRLVGKLVADPQIDERRRFRRYAVVFDQWTPAKAAKAECAEPRPRSSTVALAVEIMLAAPET